MYKKKLYHHALNPITPHPHPTPLHPTPPHTHMYIYRTLHPSHSLQPPRLLTFTVTRILSLPSRCFFSPAVTPEYIPVRHGQAGDG